MKWDSKKNKKQRLFYRHLQGEPCNKAQLKVMVKETQALFSQLNLEALHDSR